MDEYYMKSELIDEFCQFCLGHGDLKHLHEVYHFDEKVEIYHEIILSCFNIDIIPLKDNSTICMICNNCISRLRDAHSLKQQIETSLKLFEKHLESSILKDDNSKDEMSHSETEDEKCTIKTIQKKLGIANKNSDKISLKSSKSIHKKESCDEKIEKNITNIKHKVYKLDKNDLTCKICNETFPVHYSLVRHLPVHFPNYICDVCGELFSKQRSLKSHRLRHNNKHEVCPICKKLYKADHLKRHIRQHDTSRVINCPKCPEKFAYYYKRMKHLVELHNDEPNKYKCKQCPKQFSGAGLLRRHIRRDHLQERKHICDECGTAFFSKRDLSRHILKHTGIKLFQCDLCLKSFQRKCHLTEHMKIHNNDKRHQCLICDKRFTQKCTLKIHMKTHNKIKPDNKE